MPTVASLRPVAGVILALALATLTGCADRTITMDRGFDISRRAAEAQIQAMAQEPVAMQRPILVLGGWFDPGFRTNQLAKGLRRATGSDRIIAVSFAFVFSFDDAREKVRQAVEQAYGSSETEVDVVAFSMGGLIARYAAKGYSESGEEATGPRLRIARLFTIGTPHRGAAAAWGPFLIDPMVRRMTRGSDFIKRLNEERSKAEFPIISYARLGDWIVGPRNAALPGQTPYWVDTPPLGWAHGGAVGDPRILADIARRLRGQTPLTDGEPGPLPD